MRDSVEIQSHQKIAFANLHCFLCSPALLSPGLYPPQCHLWGSQLPTPMLL